jgi:hypothetical protein
MVNSAVESTSRPPRLRDPRADFAGRTVEARNHTWLRDAKELWTSASLVSSAMMRP